jgi:hypothetical protein
MTQWDLSDRTADLGCRVLQNTISRLESGAAYRIDNRDQLETLGKALGYERDRDFIYAAYGPNDPSPDDDGPLGPEDALIDELIEVIRDWPKDEKRRAVRVVKALTVPPPTS